jgi:hypothetical protein
MKKLLFFFYFSVCSLVLFGQNIESKYPKTLKCPNDTFFVKFSNSNISHPMQISEYDTLDMGTDGVKGIFATISYGKDSLVIHHKNFPYEQLIYIPIESPTHKTIYRLHFNGVRAFFDLSYMDNNQGKINIELPEVYELANIIWTLSPTGQKAKGLHKEGEYYERVINHFKPFMNHKVFKSLDFPDSIYFTKYYDFRENSYPFKFKGNKIVCEGPYYYIFGDNSHNFNSLFRELIPHIEDFAKKSKFREFYSKNKAFYEREIARQKELLPIKDMWEWLEVQFPYTSYNSYKIVFSPLIGGSHSTQNFWGDFYSDSFGETIMFICGTGSYYDRTDLSPKVKTGLMSGIVFTEIDHNYVNPESNKYYNQIDSIFSSRKLWTTRKGDNNFYTEPIAVFNEYMTHAVFCLWVLDYFPKDDAEIIIKERESLMVDHRGFSKFKEFTNELITLRANNQGIKVNQLYPEILKWCESKQ